MSDSQNTVLKIDVLHYSRIREFNQRFLLRSTHWHIAAFEYQHGSPHIEYRHEHDVIVRHGKGQQEHEIHLQQVIKPREQHDRSPHLIIKQKQVLK